MFKIIRQMYGIKIRMSVNRARQAELATGVPEEALSKSMSWAAQNVALAMADLLDPEGKP